jgi:SulP family sulfate permease
MIFGVAKTISREHNAIEDCDAVLFDLSEVSHLGVTASLALENAIKEAVEVGRSVYLVVIAGSATRTRLEKLKLLELLPEHHVSEDREEILRRAVGELPVLQEV